MLAVVKCFFTPTRSLRATQRLRLLACERRSKRVSKSFRLSDRQRRRLPTLSRHEAVDETSARRPRGALTDGRHCTHATAIRAALIRKCPGLPAECARPHLRSRDCVRSLTRKRPQSKNRKLLRCDRLPAAAPDSYPSRRRTN